MSENPLVKRLVWNGLVTGLGALATLVAHRLAGRIWQRMFDEEPPE